MKRTFLVECLLDRSQFPRTFVIQVGTFDEALTLAWEHAKRACAGQLISFQVKEVVDL